MEETDSYLKIKVFATAEYRRAQQEAQGAFDAAMKIIIAKRKIALDAAEQEYSSAKKKIGIEHDLAQEQAWKLYRDVMDPANEKLAAYLTPEQEKETRK